MRQPDARRSVESYRRLAARYDASCERVMRVREETVGLLDLRPADVVVDVASGTGLSFPLLISSRRRDTCIRCHLNVQRSRAWKSCWFFPE